MDPFFLLSFLEKLYMRFAQFSGFSSSSFWHLGFSILFFVCVVLSRREKKCVRRNCTSNKSVYIFHTSRNLTFRFASIFNIIKTLCLRISSFFSHIHMNYQDTKSIINLSFRISHTTKNN